ncbi:MAG: hypothetical protein JJ974_00350 [Phycisphaerales bacterium]|nr:hypothetical protein [Phycisphaerales bacterium]
MSKPKIRVLRHLARSGGTLISKCLGCMDDVVLISEIHPANLMVTNPMKQAVEWFKLVPRTQMMAWKLRKGPTFEQFIWACHTTAQSRNQILVLRDWSHLDYHGVPFANPTMGSGLTDALEPMFDVVVTCTVRHPLDQYLSFLGIGGGKRFTRAEYLKGCAEYAKAAVDTGYVRYEDFTNEPEKHIRLICERLEMPYDEGFLNKWWSYTTITGDTVKSVGRGNEFKEIRSFKRRSVDEELLKEFRANEDYQKTCELLGYEQ